MDLFNAPLIIGVEVDLGNPLQEANFFITFISPRSKFTLKITLVLYHTTNPTNFITPWNKAVIMTILLSAGIFVIICQTLCSHFVS